MRRTRIDRTLHFLIAFSGRTTPLRANKIRQNKKLGRVMSGYAGLKAGGEIASWRIIPSPVQEAGERKLAAALISGRAGNFLCHRRRKMTDLRRTQI